MASRTLIDTALKIYKSLGGNTSKVLGTRTNVNFLGKGQSPELMVDMDINPDALGVLPKSKAVEELESAMGYLTSGKLNDLQANQLIKNMNTMKSVYDPAPAPANITDMVTGTRNLDREGLASLRLKGDDFGYVRPEDMPAKKRFFRGVEIKDPTFDEDLPFDSAAEKLAEIKMSNEAFEQASKLADDLPPPGSRGGPDDIAAPFQSAEETIKNIQKTPFDEAVEYNARPEDVVQNLVDQKFGIGYFDNVGSNPAQRGSAREFLVEALKKENPNQTSFSDIIEEVDVKYITEGGGGAAGDPLALVDKYFGPRIRELVPSGASSEEIAIFTERVLNNVVDANGLRPTDPRFDRLTAKFVENFARGGLAKILEV